MKYLSDSERLKIIADSQGGIRNLAYKTGLSSEHLQNIRSGTAILTPKVSKIISEKTDFRRESIETGEPPIKEAEVQLAGHKKTRPLTDQDLHDMIRGYLKMAAPYERAGELEEIMTAVWSDDQVRQEVLQWLAFHKFRRR